MAPHAGTAGLKVLLAGQSQEDLNGAQTFLAGEGAIVTTSFVKADLATLLQSDAFDVAVVEVEAEAQAAAQSNSLQFLTASSLPTVVALDAQDAASMVIAVELGAVDIFQKPVSSQTGRLGTLWQHTLRKRSSAASPASKPDSCNTSSGAGSTAAEPTVCTAGDDLVKAILPDLFEADLWDEQTITGTSGEHGSSIDTPETPDISHHLRQDYSSSQTLLSNYPNDFSTVHSGSSPSHEQAHSVNSALSPVLVPQVVSTECEISSFELQPTFSECLEYAEGDPSEDSRQSKKQKVEWTRELHDKFVSAVEALSVDKAVPSKILERMGTCSEGLTRQNIASHLQKYRNRKRSRQGQNFAAPFKSSSSAHLPLLLPAPAMTSWGPPQPACWTPHPSQTPGQCGAPYNWAQAAPPTAGPFNPNIALTISEMLSQPQGPPPLGLKLDTAAVLAQMSNTRLIQA